MCNILLKKILFVIIFSAVICPLSFADTQFKLDDDTVRTSHKYSYYSISPDLRLCISPLCGGYWIAKVNRELTRCADGSLQEQCYVAEIDWSAIDLDSSEGATLVLGKQRRRNFPGFGRLGILIPEDAWRPATDAVPEGIWYSLEDTGLVCITVPCYNIEQRVLNSRVTQTISGLDLSQVDADPADIEAAFDTLSNDELIAVGENQVIEDEGPAGDGLTLIASQFFLSVQDDLDDDLYCETVADCELTTYSSYVNSPAECYCPVCPVPLNIDAAHENEESWEEYCTEFGYHGLRKGITKRLLCPLVLCEAPMPLACVNNQCVFQEVEQILEP